MQNHAGKLFSSQPGYGYFITAPHKGSPVSKSLYMLKIDQIASVALIKSVIQSVYQLIHLLIIIHYLTRAQMEINLSVDHLTIDDFL